MSPIILTSKTLSVSILPRGATLAAVRRAPNARNLVLGFADAQDHLNIPVYSGALVGPIANRVSGGRVMLDGTQHQMERNENGTTALHSGATGVHAHIWSVQRQTAEQVVLTTTLKDGEGGLPGHREITASYTVSGTTLRLEITAKTDRPTPMNIAAHPYWNLDQRPDVSRHTVQIHATEVTPTDAQNIPTGAVTPVKGTLYDFSAPTRVPLDPALDINFCLARTERPAPVHAATLTGSDGTQLDIATTAPGLQVYNGAHLPNIAGVLDGGGDLRPFAGIALEPQCWPNAPNTPQFPQITLHPGTTWRQITTYQLTVPN